MNCKTAFVTFFPIIPNNMGSSTVVNSRFKSWPKSKKIFQISHVKKLENNSLSTIYINKESPIRKILKLPKLIFEVFTYLKKSKKKILLVEGASWIFYSFFTIFFIKIILPDCKIIYISHSIESEIRKKYSNYLVYLLTKILEYFVFKISDLSTAVSNDEKIKIKKLYNKTTKLYPNAINLEKFKFKKEKIKDFIIYTGSYLYKPNKEAIDFLNNDIMPNLVKKFPNLKLVITGGGFNQKFPWIINKGIVSKNNLYNLIYNSKCMCVPLKFGSGTRIKIIEALSLGVIVVSTSKGIEGIKLNSKNPPFISNSKKSFIISLTKIIKNNKKIKQKAKKECKNYKSLYSMKNITKKFIDTNLRNYLNEYKKI
tara:strand:+ start:106 stop:1212 length:1107 start_codon:yes stop_codon:yes gene_type:complete